MATKDRICINSRLTFSLVVGAMSGIRARYLDFVTSEFDLMSLENQNSTRTSITNNTTSEDLLIIVCNHVFRSLIHI